ncbi:MAG TPA: acyl-CoA dehydrogenase family protein [Candidatus Kryptonia bacterium]|nr:acyl-CoA dehydrogenase family protein [Candidatus Kryptonia bacterium]
MAFIQAAPQLGNQYDDDRVLRDFLTRTLPSDVHRAIEPSLREMGALAGGELFALSERYRDAEPELIQWDPWGNRIDEIRVTPAWEIYARRAVEHGLIATAYERRQAQHSRLHQFALVYLFHASSQIYTCPLSMTDGAARTLEVHGSSALRERAIPRLTSRDPHYAWTSGQWMTEQIGGSDVGLSETLARQSSEGWRLYGTKWFTSATTSDMALTLARPEGNGPGGRGLAMFYLEQRTADGRLNGIRINRLKDKLGTRALPTAELELDGTLAEPVAGLADGTRMITPMLNITRTWNAVCAVSSMRRGIALARDYASRRRAFGASLSDKPLHLDTLATMQAEFEAAFSLVFFSVSLLGREEVGIITDEERALLRLLQPITKLLTAKQAIAVASETLEAFGGAGYVEDTGLPVLLRDTQVLSIWEGTTNVLALDAFRAIAREGGLAPFLAAARTRAQAVTHSALRDPARLVLATADHAEQWLAETQRRDAAVLEASARRFAFTLGRTLELALLLESAQWAIDRRRDYRAAAAAARFASSGIDALTTPERIAAANRALALDEEWSQL